MTVPVLLVTGTVGAGKTAVTEAMSELLSDAEVPHAALDLDAVIWQYPVTSRWNDDLLFENLAALWRNYAAHGSTRLVLARVVEDPADLDRYRSAVPGADITVVRVVAPHDTRLARLRHRMPPGDSLDWHLARTGELHDILEASAVEDFTVDNGNGRALLDVAREVLERAGWR